ncbi:craniofacial development protein 2-like protein [Plakobranchus ocellatus]|uniref:Craniofacial development protein 2-like protein n=1 Tax=Plakobranchus ocellatus TaxID=259542 RepID=A0AAV4CPV4_9GAST|nr:craniofacial development protein 2-like protein [Plakobranchus ocellatus]
MSRPKINSKNDVKEGSCFKSIPVSSGRESYVPQVTPDRHQATARKLKDKLNIATWNIRTLLQKEKLEEIKQGMERMKLNILGLSEVRWKGAGKITSGGHEIIYSGGTESEKRVGIIVDQTASKAIKGYWALSDRVLLVKIAGKPLDLNIIQVYASTANSNDEDLYKFYNDLDTAKTQCKSQDPLIIMEESRKKGLELNSKKTDVMVISRKQESPKCDIFINKVKLKQTEKFKYLGTIISNDGKTSREISARTAQAKINFQKMKTIVTNKHISIETRKIALQCYIELVLMYGCKA